MRWNVLIKIQWSYQGSNPGRPAQHRPGGDALNNWAAGSPPTAFPEHVCMNIQCRMRYCTLSCEHILFLTFIRLLFICFIWNSIKRSMVLFFWICKSPSFVPKKNTELDLFSVLIETKVRKYFHLLLNE